MPKTEEVGVRELDGKEFHILLIPPSKIVVLPQMRKTFNQSTIEELAESIRANGQINEALVNHVHRRYELIAGERRYRAVDWLNKSGEQKGRRLSCKVFTNLTPSQTFPLQVAENIHENVPPDQEAEAIYGLWQIKMGTAELEEMTLKEFCHQIGRSETKVRGAFRFIQDLHPDIRKEIQGQAIDIKGDNIKSRITYSAAVEIARLHSQDEQLHVFQRCLVNNARTAPQVKSLAKHFLMKQRGENQLIEFKLDSWDETKAQRSLLAKALAPRHRASVEYYRSIISGLEQGFLAKDILTKSQIELLISGLELQPRLMAILADALEQGILPQEDFDFINESFCKLHTRFTDMVSKQVPVR